MARRERGLYKRNDSPYWWLDTVLPDGRRVRQSTRVTSLADAEAYLVRLKGEAQQRLRDGAQYQPDRRWQDAVVRFCTECSEKRSFSDDKDHLKKLDPYLRDRRLTEINMDVLFPFVQQRKQVDKVKNATVNRALEVVRRILYLCCDDWNWIPKVPKIRMLKVSNRRIRFITHEEADCLLAELPPHLTPIVRFALNTGCRRREMLELQWRCVDLERRVAWLDPGTTKNGDGRGIPLNREAVLALRDVQGQHRHYCFTYRGRPLGEVGEAFQRALKRAGIEHFRFHDLRHTWASWHVQSGTSLQQLMELGGWKSYEMVLRYAHLAPEHLADAAARIERRWESVGENSTISLR